MRELAQRFERLVRDIFVFLGYEAEIPHRRLLKQERFEIDLEVYAGQRKFIVEIKMQGTRRIPVGIVRNALLALGYAVNKYQYAGGVLVTAANIEPSIREELSKEFGLDIIERSLLIHLTRA